MEQTRNEPQTLHVYECANRHRVYRQTTGNNAGCSRCGKNYEFIGAINREDGEPEQVWHVRALTLIRSKESVH